MKIKTTKFDTFFVACMGYPGCKNSMNMPRGIVKIQMLDKKCNKCKN